MQRNWAKFLLKIALSLGMSATMASMAMAQVKGGQAPTTPQTPSELTPRPSDSNAQNTSPTDSTPTDTGADNSGQDSGSPESGGTSAAMLGRVDTNNRFNLFDTMSAIPMSRVWVGFQYADKFNTNFNEGFHNGIPVDGNADAGFRHRGNQLSYRLGAEYALSCDFSIAVQGQYVSEIDINGVGGPSSGFTNPEVMAKYAFVNSDCTTLAATLGANLYITPRRHEPAENDYRFLPGFLAYHKMDKAFVQAGTQLGIPTGHHGYTWDNALSVGYWLVGGEGPGAECHDRFITGIAPQLEVFSKYVLADRNVPGEFFLPIGDVGIEPRWVVDLTVGVTVFIKDRIWVANAVSLPLTGPDARNFEYITTIGFKF